MELESFEDVDMYADIKVRGIHEKDPRSISRSIYRRSALNFTQIAFETVFKLSCTRKQAIENHLNSGSAKL